MTRRQMISSAGLVAAAVARPAASRAETAGFQLGVATYSLREFQRGLAIRMIQQLGVTRVSVKDFHLPYTSTAAEIARAVGDFHKAGLAIVSGGNTDMKSSDPADLRKYFEYAKACGMPMLVTAPLHENLGAIEKLATEYDIRIAIHTHGPEDKNFPNPKVVLDAVKGMDPRMGLCMDVGHSMRTGADVVQEIANAGPRLLDMHIKDLKDGKVKESQCDVGDGVMPVVAIFKQLHKIGYNGSVNLEYEINADNPLPGMLHSFGYMKGVLAGLAG
ncbi:MAG TPA: sugar phosphate isomerase/epimerase [Bryobacteraceae bacterium]|nr:sugar phosphate isomerase/epimerase [Bryobacteraceae bacterium]